MKSAQNDMTVGNPMKIIFGFTLPIFIGNVFQQFYNMADAVIVGKFVGNKALAAVGSTGTIMFLIYGFVVGMTAGFTVLTAQKFGAGDMKGMRKTVAGAGILSFVVGALLTILFMAFMKPLLILMNTPSDIFADAYSYIMIVSGGILAQMLYNLLSSILRALGNSKLPLVFLIISALLNIVLDLVFIVGFGMGAKGAAVATVIAQGVSGILCLFYIIAKIPILHLKREDLDVGSTIYKNQLRIGVPMALQYSITAIGTMMVQSSLNILGSTLVAAYTAAGKIEQVVTQAYVAMGTTMATYAAQNMGAGSVKRIREGFKACTVIGVVYSFVAAGFIMTVGKYMTYLFVSEDVDIIMNSVDIYLKCIGIFFIPLAVVNIYRNGIQGLGYGLLPMMAGVAELIGRGVVAVIAGAKRSYPGVCLAGPAAWVLAGGLLIVMYYFIMNVNMRKIFGTNGKDHK
ncbi:MULTISPECIES: MATE family efflux transporter [Blautia]|uniref:MATE family efflux transporter n=1 Tax=Blautia TaxID=572511 RepID=UPI000E4B3634|nr:MULTISPECIES: MATE family efflux transporter [Blautia]NSG38217.1 MATE family efflux transporter [Blautia obeum]RGG64661.1 MATE family efflux transporter [Blautia sp. AF19-10LB]